MLFYKKNALRKFCAIRYSDTFRAYLFPEPDGDHGRIFFGRTFYSDDTYLRPNRYTVPHHHFVYIKGAKEIHATIEAAARDAAPTP